MSEIRHTPGPWHFDGGADFTVHERNGNCLAEVYDSRTNARLIAAAPELYQLVADIEESMTADNTYRLLREACRTALAKVRGETA